MSDVHLLLSAVMVRLTACEHSGESGTCRRCGSVETVGGAWLRPALVEGAVEILARQPVGETRLVPIADVTATPGYCIFCRRHKSDAAESCTYGGKHEFGVEARAEAPQPKKPDPKLCVKCGLHPKNPASATNGCAHEYGG